MSGDDLARRLHDTATRGGSLSAEERALLEAWYAGQDREEAAALARTVPGGDVAALQAQVDAALARLVTVTQRIRTLTAENEAVRQEIAVLQHRLTRQPRRNPHDASRGNMGRGAQRDEFRLRVLRSYGIRRGRPTHRVPLPAPGAGQYGRSYQFALLLPSPQPVQGGLLADPAGGAGVVESASGASRNAPAASNTLTPASSPAPATAARSCHTARGAAAAGRPACPS